MILEYFPYNINSDKIIEKLNRLSGLSEQVKQYDKCRGMAENNPHISRQLAKTTGIIKDSLIFEAYKKAVPDTKVSEQWEALGLIPSLPPISILPPNSWAIRFDFSLRKPYISRDDTDLYIVDNPVKKEWVFKLPYVAPSQWKGALRAAFVWQLTDTVKDLTNEEFADLRFRSALLFGSENGEDFIIGSILEVDRIKDHFGNGTDLSKYLDKLKPGAVNLYRQKVYKHFNIENGEQIPSYAGRLYFYPTYFLNEKLDFRVINSHSRDTGIGKNPVYYECVSVGAKGTFMLLYVPLNLKGFDDKDQCCHSFNDLHLTVQIISDMMTVYGFGAKTGSGFGVANNEVTSGEIVCNIHSSDNKDTTVTEMPIIIPVAYNRFFDDNGNLLSKLLGQDGELLSNKQYKEKKPLGNNSVIAIETYKAFKIWYEQNKSMFNRINKPLEFENYKLEFVDFNALISKTDEIAAIYQS